MIELKRYNYFTGNVSDVGSAVGQIVKFFDLAGRNYVLFTPIKPSSSSKYHDLCLYHYLENKIEFYNLEDFLDKMSNKSNLFRVDLLVFDFWSIPKNLLWKYIEKIKEIEVDSIIVAKEYHYKSTDDVNDFHVRSEYKELHHNDVWITDNQTKVSSTIQSLKLSYIRDKKIDNIFGNEEDI
jgi:hypothetical protein